ncbi:putative oxidoreductase [Kineosphaera limosa NBRC 100340]|uniref:Putative oxidoreductase n=2 Tax=Kineosphaera TaxID=211469 RepID=K6X880_9MICO|nr:putative oxidoreductase [Kineosphaera limosa NBRC 100340]
MQRVGGAGGTPSPVDAVGGAFIDRTPPWLKDSAVGLFGTNDKVALYVGIAIVLVLLSCLVGLLAVRRFVAGAALLVLLVVVAAAAVLSRPQATPTDLLPLLLGAVVGLGSLWFLTGTRGPAGPEDEARPSDAATAGGVSRRVLMGAGGAAVLVGVVGVAVGRVVAGGARGAALARSVFVLPKVAHPVAVPAGADLGISGVTPFIVPNADFYRIDTALVVPRIDPASWSLRVTGMVDREVRIDWATLLTKPMQEAMVTLMCVSNEVGGTLNGNAIWTGWPVRELLREAGVQPGADMVLSRSIDGFTAGTPLETLTDDRNSLIAIAQNGEPLLPEHGFPVRLVVPGLYGYVSATKWLAELKVTTFAQDQGYWTPRGWSALGPVKTQSRIDVPRDRASVFAGTVAVAGVAWAQHRGITGVQVQVDAGDWRDARLGTDATIDAWRQWVYEWPATPGTHTIAVRAVDATGPETATQAPPAPNGASGHHTITVTVA